MHPKLDDELYKVTFISACIHLNDNPVPEIYILDSQDFFFPNV